MVRKEPSFGAVSAFLAHESQRLYRRLQFLLWGREKNTQYKWLDLREFCERSLPDHAVHRIKYFTAQVNARPNDPDQPIRQQTYWRALATLHRFYIHTGNFRERKKVLPLHSDDPLAPSPPQLRFVEAMVSEEKGSDVNLATELLSDGFRGDFEAAVIVSDDSDLISPIKAVRQHLQLQVAVLNPQLEFDPLTGKKRHRKDLARAATAGKRQTQWFYEHIDRSLLAGCQFPDPVVDKRGRPIHKPSTW